jgi:hypothetical protein
MPRTTPIQEDFSAGEITPHTQGHVSSAVYKAGASRIVNMLPRPEGGFASRDGAEFIYQDIANPSHLIPLDGCGIEGLVWDGKHLFDQRGMYPYHREYSEMRVENMVMNFDGVTMLPPTHADWVDAKTQRLYLRAAGNARSVYARATVTNLVGPAGTIHQLDFTHSGDPVRVVVQYASGPGAPATYLDTTVNAGFHSLTFDPGLNNFYVDFLLTTAAVANDVKSANIWNINLAKNFTWTAPFGISGNRYTTFWYNNTFYVVAVTATGGLNGLFYTNIGVDRSVADFRALGLAGEFANVPPGTITSVASYQQRLWIGYADGRICATKSGYGTGGVPTVFTFSPISSPPKAAEPLDLRLSSRSRAITWMTDLRGLMLGTEGQEMNFSQKQALALDPTTGLTFDVTEHSWYGSDRDLPALPVMNKILFPLKGRQKLRLASFDFESYGGFEGVDFGPLGEHLLKARVRSYCIVKTPTPRVVMAMDDGTVAIATLGDKEGVAWSRLMLPAPADRVYSVCATETKYGTNLWLKTQNGIVMRIADLDSYLRSKKFWTGTIAASLVSYKDWSTDPIMLDVYLRVPVSSAGGGGYKMDFSSIPTQRDGIGGGGTSYPSISAVPNFNVLVNSQYLGSLPNVGSFVTVTGFSTETYIDGDGLRQPAEGFLGLAFVEHRLTTLKREGDNPNGTSQAMKGRRVDVWLRVADSYMPLVNGERTVARDATDNPLANNQYVTGDVLAKGLGYTVGSVLDIVQDLPFRVEVEAIFGVTFASEL